MKNRRFLSVFLLFVLVFSFWSAPGALALETPDIAAKAALLVDEQSGEILYEKNCHAGLPQASITKVMTCLLTMEAIDEGKLHLSDVVTVSPSAMQGLDADGSSAGILVGETLSIEDLMYCMMVVSANEACNILAEQVSGSTSAFVEKMNERAAALGCENTHFANASGLHDAQHYSSAWDIYLITKAAMEHEAFMTYCNATSHTIPATNLSEERVLHTTNYLLDNWRARGYRYADARGVKTGSTPQAGYCLVSSAVRGSRTLISVVLGAERVTLEDGTIQTQSFTETTKLFDYGFDNFSMRSLLSADELICEVPVTLSSEANYVVVHPEQSIERMIPNDLDPADLTRTVVLHSEEVEAPVAKGDALGELELSYNGTVYATVKLLAANDVSASKLLQLEHKVLLFLDKTLVKIALCILGAAIALLILRALFSGSRSRGRSSYRGYRGRRKR